jgi:hypothetical protein
MPVSKSSFGFDMTSAEEGFAIAGNAFQAGYQTSLATLPLGSHLLAVLGTGL